MYTYNLKVATITQILTNTRKNDKKQKKIEFFLSQKKEKIYLVKKIKRVFDKKKFRRITKSIDIEKHKKKKKDLNYNRMCINKKIRVHFKVSYDKNSKKTKTTMLQKFHGLLSI